MKSNLFQKELREIKRKVRLEIEKKAEAEFEEARAKGYAECMLEICDDVEIMTSQQKESLRISCLLDLDFLRKEIDRTWERQVNRIAVSRVGRDIWFSIVIVTFLFFAFSGKRVFFGIVLLVLFAALALKALSDYTTVCFATDILLINYEKYGRTEAALHLADAHHLSRSLFENKTWIYTTSHKITPP